MITEADNQMLQWTKDVLGESIGSLTPPAKERQGRGVGIHLLDVVPEPRERGAPRPRLQLWLKYLMTCWADSAGEAHRMLGELFLAALQHPDLEVQSDVPSATMWQAFGVPPQPCLVVRSRVWQELPIKSVKLVRKTVIETVQVAPLHGVVIGMLDKLEAPLSEAAVELPALGLSTRTDEEGHFHFPSVPLSIDLGGLLVRARGREMTQQLESFDRQLPLSVHFLMEE